MQRCSRIAGLKTYFLPGQIFCWLNCYAKFAFEGNLLAAIFLYSSGILKFFVRTVPFASWKSAVCISMPIEKVPIHKHALHPATTYSHSSKLSKIMANIDSTIITSSSYKKNCMGPYYFSKIYYIYTKKIKK